MTPAARDIQVVDHGPETALEERVATTMPVAGSRPAEVPPGSAGPVTSSSSVPAGGLAVIGVLSLMIGAWGGVVPFVAPSFGLSAAGTVSWYWNLQHSLLWVMPGALATVCGLAMLGIIPRAYAGFGRLGSAVTGLVVAVCGAWFVIGPLAWPVLERSGGVFVPASPIRELGYQVGYSLGPGVLLAMLGTFAMGWAVRSRHSRVAA